MEEIRDHNLIRNTYAHIHILELHNERRDCLDGRGIQRIRRSHDLDDITLRRRLRSWSNAVRV